MNRWLGASILVSMVAVALAACSDSSSGGYYYAPASAGGGDSLCSQYTSCGTCTPVQGCGWCFTRASGMCASSPDECGTQEFTWTWDPSGCPGVDAGVVPATDAGSGG